MSLKTKLTYVFLTGLTFLLYSFKKPFDKPRVLVFSKTLGWHHSCIPFGIAAIQKLGTENGFDVDTTTNSANFNDDNLKKYQAVIFNCTTGNVLNAVEQAAFERYIQAGGGFMGVHSAADTEYDWPWYGKLVGAYFSSHPNNSNIRKATIDVTDKSQPATANLPTRWERTDEWYNYKSIYSGIHVLASLDENTYDGGTNGANHPITWYHEFDGGRAFYTGCGHTDESYSDPLFLGQLLGGIKYAMGNGKPLDYGKSYSKVAPDQTRFIKTVLVSNIASPMELAAAKDGRVFFTQLMGNFSVYNTKTNKFKVIHKFPITYEGGTGVIGLTLDPDFEKNQFVYIYYMPAGQTIEPLNFQLSRFKLSPADVLDLKSEKILFKVPVQKVSGAHHGGSLAWDKDKNLYLSTGDSSSPFPSDGYAPLDERPGTEHYSLDAQRSAGNTNDFKGKILRIHPEADGTYTIPEGNLFPKGMAKTKPEIYVMGCRNPYRIAVNPKTSVLYWGEIGPDAGNDSPRGPRGYDEFNQARKAGNFGWPYFVGNNFAYSHWDFVNAKPGPNFDPKAPVNNSPNNTGLNVLPPAMPAMIWYPYAASDEFPELGMGGRCAIGGDFYEFDKSVKNPNKFPEYYDGTLFVADWMRNWVIDLRFDENENYLRNEAFMPANGDFRRPIDMQFGPDGALYMLEYGSVYGAQNEDARLVKIEYNTGNRAPIAKASISDTAAFNKFNKMKFLTSEVKEFPAKKEIAGQAPLKVSFSSQNSKDLDDDDKITYQWLFDGKTVGAATPSASYTFTKPGVYRTILKVTDRGGLSGRDTVIVRVGNTKPEVTIASADNKSFIWKGKPFHYHVVVSDKEDGKIDPKKVKLFYIYNPQPSANSTTQNLTALSTTEVSYPGKGLIANSDCKSCHTINKTAVGPSFLAIANRYKMQKGAIDQLSKKIIAGGAGSWGTEHVMSAHPQLSNADTKEIVKYIFSLTDKKSPVLPLPLTGTLNLKFNNAEPRGEYTLLASYIDKGGKVVGPLKATDMVVLRNSAIKAVYADELKGFNRFKDDLSAGNHKSYVLFRNIDLTNISKFAYKYASKDYDGEIEVRIDSQAGPVISSVAYSTTGAWDKTGEVTGQLNKPVSGKHDVYFFAIKHSKPSDGILNLKDIQFVE
ncbi:cytochrome c [Mucilaginibacter gossypiicola]|uniref:Cytochrome c n=1 Tax=Mucilaginibacter gossypiicola TaxID=551995 RepID=A0A1H8J7F3_9SPHI|nr:ThuA domain-containing protein [Mucilaginibacter gossypiicola]SEN76531.1 cytochrome c [Mucilaginibacter gossypiicola]